MISTNTHSIQQGQRVTSAIRAAADRSGVDFDYLLQQARVESGLNPNARARTSSATGLYQFVEQTWLATINRHGRAHGLGWAAAAVGRQDSGRLTVDDAATRRAILDLRRNPEVAAAMAAELAADNANHLRDRLGRDVTGSELYLAHFLGVGGATRFLQAHADDPEASAAALLPAAARANRSIFFAGGAPRSLEQVRQLLAARMDDAGGTYVDSRGGPAQPQISAMGLILDASALAGGPMAASSAALLSTLASRQRTVAPVPPSPALARAYQANAQIGS